MPRILNAVAVALFCALSPVTAFAQNAEAAPFDVFGDNPKDALYGTVTVTSVTQNDGRLTFDFEAEFPNLIASISRATQSGLSHKSKEVTIRWKGFESVRGASDRATFSSTATVDVWFESKAVFGSSFKTKVAGEHARITTSLFPRLDKDSLRFDARHNVKSQFSGRIMPLLVPTSRPFAGKDMVMFEQNMVDLLQPQLETLEAVNVDGRNLRVEATYSIDARAANQLARSSPKLRALPAQKRPLGLVELMFGKEP